MRQNLTDNHLSLPRNVEKPCSENVGTLNAQECSEISEGTNLFQCTSIYSGFENTLDLASDLRCDDEVRLSYCEVPKIESDVPEQEWPKLFRPMLTPHNFMTNVRYKN